MLRSTRMKVFGELAITSFSWNMAPPRPLISQPSGVTSSAPSNPQSGFTSSIVATGIPREMHTIRISSEVGIAVIFSPSSFTRLPISRTARKEVEPEPKPMTSLSRA